MARLQRRGPVALALLIAPVLAWAVWSGWVGGLGAGAAVGAAAVVEKGTPSQATVNSLVLLLLVGAVVGYVVQLARRAETAYAEAVALQAAGAASAAGAAAGLKRESVTNYEVDKTVRVVRGGSGAIKRLSAAVVVNHQTTMDDKGKPVTKALTDQQIEQMTALVRESIGFNKERGDSLNVLNSPFVTPEKTPYVEPPVWKNRGGSGRTSGDDDSVAAFSTCLPRDVGDVQARTYGRGICAR